MINLFLWLGSRMFLCSLLLRHQKIFYFCPRIPYLFLSSVIAAFIELCVFPCCFRGFLRSLSASFILSKASSKFFGGSAIKTLKDSILFCFLGFFPSGICRNMLSVYGDPKAAFFLANFPLLVRSSARSALLLWYLTRYPSLLLWRFFVLFPATS